MAFSANSGGFFPIDLIASFYCGRWKMLAVFMCVFMCRCRLPDCENFIKHSAHEYGFCPVCVRRCLVSVELSVNAFSQCGHGYGRSPVCVLLCVTSEELCENGRWQIGQLNGFSPVCTRRWAVRFAACEKCLPQIMQLNGRLLSSPPPPATFGRIAVPLLPSAPTACCLECTFSVLLRQ